MRAVAASGQNRNPMVRAGSAWQRKPPGSRRARAVTTGIVNLQVSALSWRRPRALKEPDGGFEPLGPSCWQPASVTLAHLSVSNRPRRVCPPPALTDEYERLRAVNHGARDIGLHLAVRPLNK